MKEECNFGDFCDRWTSSGREASFTYEGKQALFDYLEQMEEDTGEDYVLDIVALDCEFAEYENMEEFWKVYDKEDYPDLETLRDHTTVIELEEVLHKTNTKYKGFIIVEF